MKTLRLVLSIMTAAFLSIGYALSQKAWFDSRSGEPDLRNAMSEFAAKWDGTPVRLISTVIIVSAIILCFVKDPRQENQ